MQLDIRLPIGLLFTIFGLVIGIYGLITSGSDLYKRSLGMNVNLWTGLSLLVFGLLMLIPALRAQKKKRQEAAPEKKGGATSI